MPKNPLKYEREYYTPSITKLLERETMRELRKDYTRMRNIAQKRLSRLKSSDLAGESQAYQRYKQGFPTLKEFGKSGQAFARAYSRLGTFLGLRTSTVTGTREAGDKIIESLQKSGFNIDRSNLRYFGEFMQTYRDIFGKNARGSDTAAELFETTERAEISLSEIKTDFAKWMDRQIELERIVASGPPPGANANWYRVQLQI